MQKNEKKKEWMCVVALEHISPQKNTRDFVSTFVPSGKGKELTSKG